MNQAYFFSTLRGNDNNDGRSANTPWRTLRKVQEISFIPGTHILLERGSVFENEYLHLAGISGTDSDPIVVDAYGDNQTLPISHANGHGLWYQDYGKPLDNPLHLSKGWVSSTIFLYDCPYIEVRNLSVTNQAVDTTVPYNDLHALDRTGVAVVAQNKGTLQHIYLDHLVVQNVDGNVYNKHMNNGGIYFTVFHPKDEAATGIARYHDVRVENCIVRNVSRWGIALAYTVYWDRFTTKEIPEEIAKHYGATDVVIRGNFVKDPGGDAITTMYCYRPLIEHNLSDGAGRQINKRQVFGPGNAKMPCSSITKYAIPAIITEKTRMVRPLMQIGAMVPSINITTAMTMRVAVSCFVWKRLSIRFFAITSAGTIVVPF